MARIFEQSTLAGLTLANRLVRSATWEGLAGPDGEVTDPLVELYRDLAQGGVGMIVSSYMYVRSDGVQSIGQIAVDRDEVVPGLRRIADAVHHAGGVVFAQIVHCGGQSTRARIGGGDPVAPSAVDSPGYREVPRALETHEVEELVEAFARAARRVQLAGFDGVQLHGAHGYLISEFLSPSRNQRTDRYGGDLQRRSRFAVEVLAAVRAAVGPEYPVAIKLNAHDYLDGSTTEVDSAFLASALAEAGIDLIEVSGGTPGSGRLSPARSRIATAQDEAYFLEQARAIRAAAPGVALALVGGLRSLERIQAILDEGVVEYLALARPLVREPGLPRRWAQGDTDRAACISCSGCFVPTGRGEGLRCVRATST